MPEYGQATPVFSSAAIFSAGGFVSSTQTLQLDDPGTANPIQLASTLGVDGRRLSIQSGGASGSAEVQLVPGPSAPQGNLNSQIMWMNQTGANYERFSISAVSSAYVIDSTYNGTGVARSIYFQMGGSISNSITSQNALVIYGDASVDLNGAAYTSQGQNWGATRTRIADWTNTGTSSLVIDTRTGTPASNVADTSLIRYRRGGSEKWQVGLNVSGQNADTFDVVGLAGTGRFIYQGSQTNGNNVFTLKNTDAGGHQWDIGEMMAAGSLSFRDFGASGTPEVLRLIGNNRNATIANTAAAQPALVLNHTAAASVPVLSFGANVLVATTAAIGANGAPPAQVDSYLPITVNGVTKKIPLYAN